MLPAMLLCRLPSRLIYSMINCCVNFESCFIDYLHLWFSYIFLLNILYHNTKFNHILRFQPRDQSRKSFNYPITSKTTLVMSTKIPSKSFCVHVVARIITQSIWIKFKNKKSFDNRFLKANCILFLRMFVLKYVSKIKIRYANVCMNR